MPASSQPSWPRRDASHLLVTSSEMAALEQHLFASGLPVEALMEKAGLAVSQRLRQGDWWPRLQQRGALVLVGPGHNGGDGLVVARELHLAGIAAQIWSPFERHKPLTAAHLQHARWLGIPERATPPDPKDPAVWIDALFGIGQQRPPGELLEQLLAQRQLLQPGLLIAIDGPTGLCADSGRLLGQHAACAALSLSIGLLKQGWVQDTALTWVGRLERVPLGLPQQLLGTLPPQQPVGLTASDLAEAPWPQGSVAAAKYQRGRLLVVAGSPAYRGAAQLCLLGASASGVGSLRAAVPQVLAEELWSVLPHVVVAAGLAGNSSGGAALEGLPAEALERLDAVVIGPGLGPGAAAAGDALCWEHLRSFRGLLVLDADGLNRLAARGDALHWLRSRQGSTWLTPHRGEFARLFPQWADQPPLEAAAAAAQQASATYSAGCSVLLKGARTVIAAADGRRWQLHCGAVAAARAGLGDVLAGYAAGLGAMANACGTPADASLLALAGLSHAAAGERACVERGPGGADPMAVAAALQQHGSSPQQGPRRDQDSTTSAASAENAPL